MQKPNDLDETASRANDQKDPASAARQPRRDARATARTRTSPQGGKRRGPGRWVDPETSGD